MRMPIFYGLAALFAVKVVVDGDADDENSGEKDAPHGKPRVERATYLLLRFMRRKQTVESDYPTTAYAVPLP